jgi:hypothetical protein
MDGESFVSGAVVSRCPERVTRGEDTPRRPPQRDLVPQAPVPDRNELERPDADLRYDVMRYAESRSQLCTVTVVPVEQLDDAHRFAGGANSLVEAVPVKRVDQPDAPVCDEGVRATLHELDGDPAEAGCEVVAGTDAHAGESTGTP